ncbi:hypothetical protein HY041_02920, partial [Candidatus Roizmanbacteria bacterium]|nr:hypothetical protein [Candidatus Roizmanbacteria bacterium]
MKICFIFSNYHLSHITGQAGLLDRLTKKVKLSLFDVSIISNYVQGRKFTKEGITHYLVKGLGDFKTYLLHFFQIIRFLKEIQPDLIHVNGVLMTIYVWFICKLFGIPFF